jgi:hypothetical protein
LERQQISSTQRRIAATKGELTELTAETQRKTRIFLCVLCVQPIRLRVLPGESPVLGVDCSQVVIADVGSG